MADEDFYSSLAAGVSDEDSDMSDADPKALASSLKGLDDMDDDILGSLTSKKKPMSQTLPSKTSDTKKPQTSATPASKSMFSIDDIMADEDGNLDAILSSKSRPKTTDDTKKSSLTSDLFGGPSKQRPATTEQPKKQPKKFDFGDFDEDDPLAGLLSDEEDDPKPKKKTPSLSEKPATPSDIATNSTPRTVSTATAVSLVPVSDETISEGAQTRAPTPTETQFRPPSPSDSVELVMNGTGPGNNRPITRSGSRTKEQEVEEDPLPVKPRVKPAKDSGSDEGSDWDKSSEGSEPAKPDLSTNKAPTAAAKPTPAHTKKKDDVVFSDEDDLDLGLDDSPKKSGSQSQAKTSSVADSLFGKSDTVQKHLQRPGTGGSQKEFVLDKKYTSPVSKPTTPASSAVKKPASAILGDDDDIFGSYAPSAISSRPGTGRSVRFEDEEPGDERRPATAGAASKLDDDWLGLAAGSQQKRPLGLASTIDFSSGGGDDWLDMAAGSSSRPKTAPEKVLDKKPPRTPTKSGTATTAKSSDDWLAELTAKVDDETDVSLNKKSILSRQNSAEKPPSRPGSRQGSLESSSSRTGGQRPALAKQKSADDWLGLGDEAPLPDTTSKQLSKSSTLPIPKTQAGGDGSDWLGLSTSPPTKDNNTDDWIKAAKSRRSSQQKDSSSDLFAAKPTLKSADLVIKSKEKADERALDILKDLKPKPSATPQSKLPWDSDEPPTPKPQTPKQAVISSLFGDEIDAAKASPEPQSKSSPTFSAQPTQASTPQRPVTTSQSVFQPMFVSQTPASSVSMPIPQFNAGAWQVEQDSLLAQHHAQVEQMQQQFNQMMEIRRQQQQAAIQQQQKMVDEVFKLQQQNLQTSMSSLGPSPVFPVGLSPTKQSEIQLNNVELEGKVRRLEHEKHHLETIISTMKHRNQEELSALETSNKSRILIVEESYQRREARLREEIEQLTHENLTKLRLVEEEKASLLSAQYRKLDELEQRKSAEIERIRQQHYKEIEDLKKDHQMALERVRKSKELELEALSTAHGNPNSLQFLMEQMKQNAAGLTQMQFQIGRTHQTTLDERELAMNTRDQQLKVLQECLSKQQEENDKERSRLQELLAKMEIQLREQERQLHQERWSLSQEKSKLSAVQAAVEQERQLLTDQLARERAELARAKDSFLAEQRSAMVQVADERRLLSEERAQLTIRQRLTEEKESTESLRQSQGSARYEGLIKALEAERESLAQRSKSLAAEEKKAAAESATIQQEKMSIKQEQERLAELAKRLQSEMDGVEKFSKDCIEKEKEGRHALHEARHIESSNRSRLEEISARLEELKAYEKKAADERLQMAAERKQLESLKTMQLCAGCKNPLSHNPYFSLSTPILKGRSAPTIGVVSPQKFDMADPTIIQYKIQAEQDNDFLNEESVYLQALKYSPYHKT